MLDVARDAGSLDDPRARDLIGEAQVLDSSAKRISASASADGIATGTISDQSAAIGRLFAAWPNRAGRPASPSSSPGAAGGAWADDDGAVAERGIDFLMRQVACIGGGTTEMARNVISERVLGMPRERTLDKDVRSATCPAARLRAGAERVAHRMT